VRADSEMIKSGSEEEVDADYKHKTILYLAPVILNKKGV